MVNPGTTEPFRLPDVGEGLTEATVVTWRVQVGDRVELNAPIVEIETAKSLVELPAPFSGVVGELLVAEGDTVPVGTPLLALAGAGHDQAGARAEEQASVLVGYGPQVPSEVRRRRRRQPAPGPANPAAPLTTSRRAKPPVRKLARDLGVDLAAIPSSTISHSDVLAAAAGARRTAVGPAGPDTTATRSESPNQTRVAATGVRRATAAAVTSSAFTAPHVTEFVTVDVTRTVTLLSRLKESVEFRDLKVTPLLLVARALLAAVRRHPEINSSWDAGPSEIVLHHDVNLGIAVSTGRGLLVPNIKRAQALNLPELANAISGVATEAREGRLTTPDLTGGTITLTNIGVFGVDCGTPILNPGEAAILCLGAINRRPWEHRGEVALRWITQLALSFDHRLVDGELGSRVLARVAAVLNNPRWELLLA